MRVSIDHHEITKGVFNKKTYHEVSVAVVFSEEELSIINQSNLADTIVLDRGHEPWMEYDEQLSDIYPLTISNLMGQSPDRHALATPLEAKQYEADLTDALQKLKAFIEENAGIEEKSTSFEL